MRRPVISLLLCLLCFSWTAAPCPAVTPWQPAFQQEMHMRRGLLRQQHDATVRQLHSQLRTTHPQNIARKRAIHECLRQTNQCYHEQLRALTRDEINLRRAYRSGYREWIEPGPFVISEIGPQPVVTRMSPISPMSTVTTVTTSPTYRVVPSNGAVAIPQIVNQPSPAGSTVVVPNPSQLAPIPDPRPVRPTVVPASNLEPLPRDVEPLPTPARAGEPTPAKRPAK